MTTLTKKQAHLLAAYDYRLMDKEGNIEEIYYIRGRCFYMKSGLMIVFSMIGENYFILARDYSQLTQEIEHEGKRFVPIIELGSLVSKGEWFLYKDIEDKIIGAKHEKGLVLQSLENFIFALWDKQQPVFINDGIFTDALHTWHFHPIGVPKEFIKPINTKD